MTRGHAWSLFGLRFAIPVMMVVVVVGQGMYRASLQGFVYVSLLS